MKNQNALIANNEPLLRDLQLFCEVARRSSFIAAATEIGLSPAHVSKRIATLETLLGVKLFNRTTRRVNITSDGEAAFIWAQKILENVESMFESLSAAHSEPRGTLRISTSLRLGREHVAPILSLLRKRHPTDRRSQLLELTDAGKQALQQVRKPKQEAIDRLFDGLDLPARQQLMTALQSIESLAHRIEDQPSR